MVCHDARRKISEAEAGGRNSTSQLLAAYAEQKEGAIAEYRGGVRDAASLKAEVESLVEELQAAINAPDRGAVHLSSQADRAKLSRRMQQKREGGEGGEEEEEGDGETSHSRPAAAEGSKSARGGGKTAPVPSRGGGGCRSGEMGLSVSSPCGNTASIVGPSNVQHYASLRRALEAASAPDGRYEVRMQLGEGGDVTHRVSDYPTVRSVLRVMAGVVVGEGDASAAKMLRRIRMGESAAGGYAWGHAKGARYCLDVAPVGAGCRHVRHTQAWEGITEDPPPQEMARATKVERQEAPARSPGRQMPTRTLASATEAFDVPPLAANVRYMCGLCEGSFPEAAGLADHECK